MNNIKTRAPFLTVKEFEKNAGIRFTRHDDGGKLAGFMSLSSSCLNNSRCQKRISATIAAMEKSYGAEFVKNHPRKAFAMFAAENSHACICGGCFSAAIQRQYSAVAVNMARNSEMLQKEIVAKWPLLNVRYFRLESFGDVSNVVQVRNYFNFARSNPETTFSVWTKNPDVYARAIAAGYSKPKNLIVILSSLIIGRVADKSKYPFVDKVFTVYADEKQAAAAGVSINCGGRKCLTCCRCYRHGGDVYINELLK